MSTKLYSGLRLADHAPDLFEVTRLVSRRMRQVFEDLRLPIIAGYMAKVIDDPRVRELGVESQHHTVYELARQLWIDHQAAIDTFSLGHDPLRFEIVFGDVRDGAGLRRLAYPIADEPAYREALLGILVDDKPIFEDYHYQNSSDRPDEVSENAWLRRRNDWNAITSSDDPETNGTFGHLPGWQLPNTIAETFPRGLWSFEPIDLNEALTPEQRLVEILEREVSVRLVRRLSSQEVVSHVAQFSTFTRKAIRAYLRSEHGEALERPVSLPLKLRTPLGDLPEPLVVPDAVLDRIVDRVIQMKEHG